MLADGSVMYQGRIGNDSQIKLRGTRIELDDISNITYRVSDGVLFDAAVILKGDAEPLLVAFIVFSTGNEPQDPTPFR